MGRLTPTVKIIIVANVILWVGTILFLKGNIINLNDMLAFHFPGSPLYKPWQFVTHMFMHANLDYGSGQVVIYHILFNMLGLWMFGSPLEQMWGRNKFIFFYFSAGVGAVLIQLGFNYYEFQSGMEVFETAGYSVTSVKELLVNYNFQSPSKQLMDLLSSDLIFAGESMQSNFLGTMLGASGALY
ncbi:MAG: rhomboid family intramembrane serine protease, partial [Maribacter stanieri]